MNTPQIARALRITNETTIDALEYVDLEVPTPGPDEVLVRMHAVSLNYRDLLVATGRYGPNLPKPLTLCSDGAGEIIATGADVTAFKPGDRVAGTFFQSWQGGQFSKSYLPSALGGSIDGCLTTLRVFSQHGIIKLPEHLSFAEGATLPCAAVTAWHSLVPTANLQSGQTVLLLGTGGVSVFGLQFAKMLGAKAIVTSSSDQKLERARTLGADETVNYKSHPDWEAEVLRLTGGKGVDVVLESGGAGTLQKSIKSTRFGGQVSLFGVLTGVTESLNVGALLHGNLRLQGIYVGSVDMFRQMNAAITAHTLHPVIDRTFAFTEAKAALHFMESAQHFGKLVITLD